MRMATAKILGPSISESAIFVYCPAFEYMYTLESKAERNGGLGGTVQINQERRESKEERK